MNSSVLDAQKYGFRTFPLGSEEAFKRPALKAGYMDLSDAELDQTVANHRGNIGIITGKRSGVVIIDVDVKHGGLDNWQRLLRSHGSERLRAPTVRTGSGGLHVYFKYKSKYDAQNSVNGFIPDHPGIDLRVNRGYVVYVGSKYYMCGINKCDSVCGAPAGGPCKFRGNTYKWETSPAQVPLPEVPGWLEALILGSAVERKALINSATGISSKPSITTSVITNVATTSSKKKSLKRRPYLVQWKRASTKKKHR